MGRSAAFVTAAVIAASAPPVSAVTSASLAAGREAYDHGAYLEAARLYRQGLAEAERAGDRALLGAAYEGLSQTDHALNDWPAMLDHARRAFETNPDPAGRFRIDYLLARGRFHMESHERDAAEQDYLEALALIRKLRDQRLLSTVSSEMGLLYWRFDRDRPRALAHYDQALEIARRLHLWHRMVVALNNEGNVFRQPGSYAEAERRYTEGLAISRRQGDPDAFLLKNLGMVHRETGRRASGERLLLEALEAADRQHVGRIRWQARMELARLYGETDPDRADRYHRECLDVLEAQHSNVLLEDYRAGVLAGAITLYDNPYDLYIDFLLLRGAVEGAFLVAERARARAFLDALTGVREQIASTVSPDFVRAERGLLRRISELQAGLRARGLAAERRRALSAEVQRAEEDLTAMRVRLAAEHPALAHARYPRLGTIRDLQTHVLHPGEALVSYFVGAEHTTAWIVRTDRFDLVRLPGREVVEAAARRYLQVLASPATEYRREALEVSRLVASPVEAYLPPSGRIIVAPDGVLGYLPFEALLDARGRFFVESHPISYVPSASSLSFLRSRPENAGSGDVLVVGNPVLSTSGADRVRGSAVEHAGLLKPLPHSSSEIRAVASGYGSAVRVLEQEEATEEALDRAGLAHATIVHFATHGLIDEGRPERSGLALTAVPPLSDGLLQTREIYQRRLSAALVTLSACQTALGREVRGEGIIGLTRAFFYAGASAVMASLWNVSDASTSHFMARFYDELRAGRTIDEAARQAKLAFLHGGTALRHPYFWAPFVVSGNGAVRPPVRRMPFPVSLAAGIVLAAAALAALATSAWRVRRRPRARPKLSPLSVSFE
jgi:CHAT domain-containing protein